MLDPSKSQVYLVGGGVAALSAAAFLVRDAGLPGENIHILEQLPIAGGSMDGAPAPTAEGGYVTRGGRMFEEEYYSCLWNLLDSIPTLDDPDVSVRQERAVAIRDFMFSPTSLVVAVGTKVSWKNFDGELHTIRSIDDSFRSGALEHNDSFSHRFNTPGTYRYVCSIHSQMVATIVVK